MRKYCLSPEPTVGRVESAAVADTQLSTTPAPQIGILHFHSLLAESAVRLLHPRRGGAALALLQRYYARLAHPPARLAHTPGNRNIPKAIDLKAIHQRETIP